jgi:hypothetical protein
MFQLLSTEDALAEFDLTSIGEQSTIASVAGVGSDGFLNVLLHRGNLAIDGNLTQAEIVAALEEAGSELAEHTLVIVSGNLSVQGRVELAEDNEYTHLAVMGNLSAGELNISSGETYVKGAINVRSCLGPIYNLVVGGSLNADKVEGEGWND